MICNPQHFKSAGSQCSEMSIPYGGTYTVSMGIEVLRLEMFLVAIQNSLLQFENVFLEWPNVVMPEL